MAFIINPYDDKEDLKSGKGRKTYFNVPIRSTLKVIRRSNDYDGKAKLPKCVYQII